LIGEGYSTKQMADKLNISINTVETHRRHLLGKIQVKNSMELIKQTANLSWSAAI
jgi:DNA-binding CsgD family transcriptional regulator